jgi:hypothetical protein
MILRIYTNESVPTHVAAGLNRRGVVAFSARDSGNLGLKLKEMADIFEPEDLRNHIEFL